MSEVSSCFPELYNHVFAMYGHFSQLVYRMKGRSVILQSQEGVNQGDPLGPALFSCAIHRVLLDIQDCHPAVVILTYLDDVLFCSHLIQVN